jgi:protease PrsW
MNVPLAIAGALPALGIMWYVDRLDAARPEPRWSLRRLAIAGGVATIPCIFVQLALTAAFPLTGLAGALFMAFVVAGATEELAKVLCLRWFIWRRPEFDERMDGIVYAARAGLGFALVENVLYLLGAASAQQYLWMYLVRAVLAVPGHAIWAGVMGYLAARRRFDGKGPGLAGGYLLAVFLHGGYDAALFSAPPLVAMTGSELIVLPLFLLAVAFIVLGALILRGMVRRALALDHEAEQRGAMARVA